MTNGGFGSFGHLAGRFFGALSPAGPPPQDEQWAIDQLGPGEQRLWRRMSGPDRRHAVGVAREMLRLLAEPPPREVIAGALMHDVGKVDSGLGTFSRVFVTLAAIGVGRDRLVADVSTARAGKLRGRVRSYLTHDQVGAALLMAADSDPITVAWTREHHLDPEHWTLPREWAEALKAADGD